MSKVSWEKIADRINEHSYMDGVERTVERVALTGEVFTPTALVLDMLRRLPIELLSPGKTVLDPACGDGQFLVAAKWVKVLHFDMSEDAALADLFGIDIMRDNVDLCRKRLGGGTIVMGDALNPLERIEGQSNEEYEKMVELFAGADVQQSLFG
jgi:SAM-dependent methyltransferase